MSLGVPGSHHPWIDFGLIRCLRNIVLAEAFDEYSEHYQGNRWKVGVLGVGGLGVGGLGVGVFKWDPLLGESKVDTNSRWWFQIFCIFTPIWGRFPIWLIFFKGVGWNHQLVLYGNFEWFAQKNALFGLEILNFPPGWALMLMANTFRN